MLIISVQLVFVMGRLSREDLRLTADSYGTKDTEIGHESTPACTES
jgi:hypothetical protein